MTGLIGALLVWTTLSAPAAAPPSGSPLRLEVPLVVQTPAHCGQAALEMVLRFYGGDATALTQVSAAYDPALRGSLITDLASAARRAGFEATVVTQTSDSLIRLLADGVPPIVLYQNGRAPMTVRHYGVVTGWDPARQRFTLHDGSSHVRTIGRDQLEHRCRTAGSQALVVRRSQP